MARSARKGPPYWILRSGIQGGGTNVGGEGTYVSVRVRHASRQTHMTKQTLSFSRSSVLLPSTSACVCVLLARASYFHSIFYAQFILCVRMNNAWQRNFRLNDVSCLKNVNARGDIGVTRVCGVSGNYSSLHWYLTLFVLDRTVTAGARIR